LVLPAYIGYQIATPAYEASVKMYVKGVKTSESEFYNEIQAQNIIGNHAQLITSNIVLNRVVESLKLYEIPDDYDKKFATPMARLFMKKDNKKMNKSDNSIGHDGAKALLLSKIVVSPSANSDMFFIQVEDFDPGLAVNIVNSLSRSYVIFDLEQQIEELKLKFGEKNSTVLQLENYITEYSKNLDGRLMPDLEAYGPASVKIITQATGASPRQRVSESLLLSFAFFAGIFLAAVLSALIEYSNNTFSTPKEVVKYLNMPFIGSIPKQKKKNELVMSDKHLPNASLKCVSSFQRVGDKIILLSKKQNIRTILITAFQEFNNSTAFIANLGLYLSRDAGKKVLIIDANLKNSNHVLADVFDISDNTGLPEVFERKKTFEEAIVKINENLDLLLSHNVSYRPISLLDSSFMSDLIREVRDKYDFVFLDCSVNLKYDTEPVILSSLTDAVILVVNEGVDRIKDVQLAIQNLMQNGDRVSFSLLNNRTETMPQILYKIS
jgi:Mrp family chromosome partitioning ATPase